MRIFSNKKRPTHLGPYPTERLLRTQTADFAGCPPFQALSFDRPSAPQSVVNAIAEYQAMLDTIRDGMANKVQADCPTDPMERANHVKSFGYFSDASMVGICAIPDGATLAKPTRNPDIDDLAEALRTRQTKTLASGIDMIMANLRDSIAAPPSDISTHTHAVVFVYEYPRDPKADEPGYRWIADAQAHRAALRANETVTPRVI